MIIANNNIEVTVFTNFRNVKVCLVPLSTLTAETIMKFNNYVLLGYTRGRNHG